MPVIPYTSASFSAQLTRRRTNRRTEDLMDQATAYITLTQNDREAQSRRPQLLLENNERLLLTDYAENDENQDEDTKVILGGKKTPDEWWKNWIEGNNKAIDKCQKNAEAGVEDPQRDILEELFSRVSEAIRAQYSLEALDKKRWELDTIRGELSTRMKDHQISGEEYDRKKTRIDRDRKIKRNEYAETEEDVKTREAAALDQCREMPNYGRLPKDPYYFVRGLYLVDLTTRGTRGEQLSTQTGTFRQLVLSARQAMLIQEEDIWKARKSFQAWEKVCKERQTEVEARGDSLSEEEEAKWDTEKERALGEYVAYMSSIKSWMWYGNFCASRLDPVLPFDMNPEVARNVSYFSTDLPEVTSSKIRAEAMKQNTDFREELYAAVEDYQEMHRKGQDLQAMLKETPDDPLLKEECDKHGRETEDKLEEAIDLWYDIIASEAPRRDFEANGSQSGEPSGSGSKERSRSSSSTSRSSRRRRDKGKGKQTEDTIYEDEDKAYHSFVEGSYD